MTCSRLLFLALLFVVSAVLLACSSSGAPPAPTPVPTPFVVRAMGELPAELQDVLDELPSIKTARADVTVELRDNRRATGFIEFEAPDRVRAVLGSADTYGAAAMLIGSEYFLRIGQDWFGRSFDPVPTVDPQATPAPVPDFALPIIRGGTATVDGKRCNLYTFPAGTGVQNDLAAAASLELCIADKHILRAVWKGGFRTITALFQYEIPVTIERPRSP